MQNQAKIFLALSLVGILFLLFLAFYLPPETLKISEINEKMLGKQVKLEGKITGIKDFSSKDFLLLTLEDKTGKITLIAFTKNKLDITNKTYIVTGKISEYNKELQITAEKIILKE